MATVLSTEFQFFLVSLAIWRASSLLAREDGPFDILLRIRMLFGVKFDKTSEEFGTNWFSKGIICVWCNSIWFSVLGSFIISGSIGWYFINLLALSAMAIIIDAVVTKG